jgi:Fe-S-cluster-containing hydrogenase component 2
VKGCPEGAITMADNLARIDYEKCTHCETCVLLCPQRTIEDKLDPSKEQAPRIKLPKKEVPVKAGTAATPGADTAEEG